MRQRVGSRESRQQCAILPACVLSNGGMICGESSKMDLANETHSLERLGAVLFTGLALLRREQALLHRFRLQQMCSFPLRRDLPSQFDRDDYRGRFPGLVGNHLDVRVLHNFSLPPRHGTPYSVLREFLKRSTSVPTESRAALPTPAPGWSWSHPVSRCGSRRGCWP
jgi:hypothetical protein